MCNIRHTDDAAYDVAAVHCTEANWSCRCATYNQLQGCFLPVGSAQHLHPILATLYVDIVITIFLYLYISLFVYLYIWYIWTQAAVPTLATQDLGGGDGGDGGAPAEEVGGDGGLVCIHISSIRNSPLTPFLYQSLLYLYLYLYSYTKYPVFHQFIYFFNSYIILVQISFFVQ